MNKILNDLLKSPTGKYSRKSFIILITFIVTIILGGFIVVSDLILEVEINRYSVDVFNTLLLFLISLLSVTVVDKKIINKSVPNVTEEQIQE